MHFLVYNVRLKIDLYGATVLAHACIAVLNLWVWNINFGNAGTFVRKLNKCP